MTAVYTFGQGSLIYGFRGFPFSGNILGSGTTFDGFAPADSDEHGRWLFAGAFKGLDSGVP
jgi:hypothetical protein